MKIKVDQSKLLIDGIVVQWTIELVNNKAVLTDERGMLRCPLCGGAMKPHQLLSVHGAMEGKAFDFNCKCIQCSYFCVFGNPIDEQTATALRPFERLFVYHRDDEILKRLKELGYW